MDNQGDTQSWLYAKLLGIWGLVGVTSWSEAASFMAFVLTCWVFGRHVWRDALRPILEHFKLIAPLNAAEAVADDSDAAV
jgi:hypothetical protein